jgi:predicted transcriptional regulator of viral defense system
MASLPLPLQDHPFSLNQALSQGLSRYALSQLVSEGAVEQLARGVYRASKDDVSEEDQFRIATLRVGIPSAICLVSALSHYGLTDAIPKKTWIMVPTSKRTHYRDVKVLRVRSPDWKIGIDVQDGYAITSLERTLVDAIHYRRLLGTQVAIEALRQSLEEKKTTLGKILDMAVKLKLDHRIRPYVEALS